MNGPTAWILTIVFMTPAGDERLIEARYESKAACVSAAKAYAARHPAVEFHDPDTDSLIEPVVRSYVACRPATDGDTD